MRTNRTAALLLALSLAVSPLQAMAQEAENDSSLQTEVSDAQDGEKSEAPTSELDEQTENPSEKEDAKTDDLEKEDLSAAEENEEPDDLETDKEDGTALVFVQIEVDTVPDCSELDADVIVIPATGGGDEVNPVLDDAVAAVLEAGKVPALAHTARAGGSNKDGREEALYFYQMTKQWKGQILPVLLFDDDAYDAGPVYVRTFADNAKELLEACPVIISSSLNQENADWSVFEDAYPIFWDDWDYTQADFRQSDIQKMMNVNEEEAVSLYRLYNPKSGEHLFTEDENERDYLCTISWKYESVAWRYNDEEGIPVYRLHNPKTGDHLYTSDENEKRWLSEEGGWLYEVVAWHQVSGGQPVYRLFNPNVKIGTHHYTTSYQEYEALGKVGWKQEGVGFTQLLPFVQRNEGMLTNYILDDCCYNQNGVKVEGVRKVNGKFYYFDPENDGLLCTDAGRKNTADGVVLIQEDGSLKNGIVREGNGFYFYDPANNCLLRTEKGLFQTAGTVILVEDGGKLATGLRNAGGWKYFQPDSAIMVTNRWVDVPASENGGTAKRVYFGSDGNMLTGVHIIDGRRYIFGDDGQITNANDLKVQEYCDRVYNEVGRDLRAVYRWTVTNLSSAGSFPSPFPVPDGYAQDEYYATYGFENRAGNCYIFASTFEQLARNLGYTARIHIGAIMTVNGPATHCWAEIYEDGIWYMYDPIFQKSYDSGNHYMMYKMHPSNLPFQYIR